MWPLFLGFKAFNWKIFVKSINKRVWSPKTKATWTFMNGVIWQNSISKLHISIGPIFYNTHHNAPLIWPKEGKLFNTWCILCAIVFPYFSWVVFYCWRGILATRMTIVEKDFCLQEVCLWKEKKFHIIYCAHYFGISME